MTLVKILDTAFQYFFAQLRPPSQPIYQNWVYIKKMQKIEYFSFPTYFLQRHGQQNQYTALSNKIIENVLGPT